MKKFLILFLLINFSFAQDTSRVEIITKATSGINISQISFKDWAQGGENSFSWTLFGNLSIATKSTDWTTRNSLELNSALKILELMIMSFLSKR
jgi:hypothetical protein